MHFKSGVFGQFVVFFRNGCKEVLLGCLTPPGSDKRQSDPGSFRLSDRFPNLLGSNQTAVGAGSGRSGKGPGGVNCRLLVSETVLSHTARSAQLLQSPKCLSPGQARMLFYDELGTTGDEGDTGGWVAGRYGRWGQV